MLYRLSRITRDQTVSTCTYIHIYVIKTLFICKFITSVYFFVCKLFIGILLLLLIEKLTKTYFLTKAIYLSIASTFWSRTIPMHIVFHRASSLSPSVLLQSSLNYQIKSQTLKFTHRYLFKEWQKYDPGKSPLKQRIFRREYLDTLSWRIQSVCACLSVCVWEFVCDYVFCYTTIELSVWMIPMK